MGYVRDFLKSDLGVDIENGFVFKYINIRGKVDVINRLKKFVESVEKVYFVIDFDREGEVILWYLVIILGFDVNDNVRIIFNEIIKKVVQEFLKNVRLIDQNLVNVQQV